MVWLPSASRLLPTNIMSKPDQGERRLALRMALRLGFVVSGRAEGGAAWSEPTEAGNISTDGTLFRLKQKVNRGDQIYLRAHRPDGTPTEVTARIIRVAPETSGAARVGVAVMEPAGNWLRLFVSWVADRQTAPDQLATP